MLFELESGIIINVMQIISINRMDKSRTNDDMNLTFGYCVTMSNNEMWYATEKDIEHLRRKNK